MDSSDGLANAVLYLCQASSVGARLQRDCLPIPPALQAWVGPKLALDWFLYGGEESELVLCLPPDRAAALLPDCGDAAAILGTVEAGREVLLVEGSEDSSLPLTWDSCFQHF